MRGQPKLNDIVGDDPEEDGSLHLIRRVGCRQLPNLIVKSLQDLGRFSCILLGLFSHVEDRTILACAENILLYFLL
jgi:hypothetical protein